MIENELKMLRLIRLCGGINRYKLCQGLAISQADAKNAAFIMVRFA
jgi:hypothetical protein